MAKIKHRDLFKCGELIPDSGIYRAFHGPYRVSHEVTLLSGERFPCCNVCNEDVHFRLVQAAGSQLRGLHPIRLYEIPHPDEDDTLNIAISA